LAGLNPYNTNLSVRAGPQPLLVTPHHTIGDFGRVLATASLARTTGLSGPQTPGEIDAFYSQEFYWTIIAGPTAACGQLVLPSKEAALHYGPRGTTKVGPAPGQPYPTRLTLRGQSSAIPLADTEIDYSDNPSRTASSVKTIYFLDDEGHRQRIDLEQTHYSTTRGASWHPYGFPTTPEMEWTKIISSNARMAKMKKDYPKCDSWCTVL
jgi:hypothetical protein